MPPKKADIFSKDVEFMLIDLVECRPILWDCTSDLYKRADLKDSAWEEIACCLGSNFSASRFKSMRDTFMSNLRRVKESKRNGKGTADIYIPKWYLYDRLKFLQKTVAQSTSVSNLTIFSEKPDDIMSQKEQTSNESLIHAKQLSYIAKEDQEKGIVTEAAPILNVYYNDSLKVTLLKQIMTIFEHILNENLVKYKLFVMYMKLYSWHSLQKFMIRSTEGSSDNFINLSLLFGSCVSTPASCAPESLRPMSTPVLQATSQYASVSISTASTRPISTSKIQDTENQMYVKRGSAKRKSDPLMEEAVIAIKTLCQSDPTISSEPNSSVSNDSAHTLGLFIAARLREMVPDQRRICQNKILKLLSQF